MQFSLLIVQDLPTRTLHRFEGDHEHRIIPALSFSENLPFSLPFRKYFFIPSGGR